MAGETINQYSSAWVALQVASSTADTLISAGAVTAISATALSADEQKYPLLDMKLTVSVGTPVVNGVVDVYRRPKADGTNQAPIPVDTDFLQQYVGSFVLDNAAVTQYYYLFGVANVDSDASYYLINNDGATLTIALDCRSRGWNTV